MASCAGQAAVVLVVEDDVLVRMIAADILADAGFCVLEAGDAEQALLILGTRSDVQAVFTDCNMPGVIGGIWLAHLIHQRTPALGIVVTSGKMRPEPKDLPPGARFVEKPYRRAMLVEAIQAVLGPAPLADPDEAEQGAAVVPQAITAQPDLAEGGAIAAAPVLEPDKS